ncbi:MAG: hypothetical protein ABI866_00060, partial [Dokdonella sp.]
KPLFFATTLIASLTMAACTQAASTPAALAKALQSALDKGDFEAARKLADIGDAPAELHFYFFDMVRGCASDAICTVTTAEADDAMRERWKKQAEQMHAQMPMADGLIEVASKSRDGSGSGTMKMPYAKVGGEYKLTSVHFSDAEFAVLRAKSDQALVDELFAEGIRDSKGDSRTDWATAATKLAADGGEPGKAFVAQTNAMAVAVDAKDPDAAMHSGGQIATIIFRDKDFEGKPIPLADRKRKLHVQSLRMLRDVKVKGGYQLGDDAVLMIEARNGIGWVVRGAVVLSRDGDSWDRAGDNTVSYPAAK